MPDTTEKRGCCGATKIRSRLRFTSSAGGELDPEQVAFTTALRGYMTRYDPNRSGPTPGEVADVLLTLKYTPPESGNDFEVLVHALANALDRYKRRYKKPFPLLSEVLKVAHQLGWTPPGQAAPPDSRARAILQLAEDGTVIKHWPSAGDAAAEVGIDRNNISACARGERKSAAGFLWRYA